MDSSVHAKPKRVSPSSHMEKNIGVDQETIANILKRGGIDHLQLRTDEMVSHHLRNFFSSRGVLGRGAR